MNKSSVIGEWPARRYLSSSLLCGTGRPVLYDSCDPDEVLARSSLGLRSACRSVPLLKSRLAFFRPEILYHRSMGRLVPLKRCHAPGGDALPLLLERSERVHEVEESILVLVLHSGRSGEPIPPLVISPSFGRNQTGSFASRPDCLQALYCFLTSNDHSAALHELLQVRCFR